MLNKWPAFRLAPVLRTPDGYTAYFMKPDGTTAMNVGVMVTAPPGMDAEVAERIRTRVKAEFLPYGYANELSQALRTVAEVDWGGLPALWTGRPHERRGGSRPVTADPGGLDSPALSPTPFQALLNATDEQGNQLLMTLDHAQLAA